MLLVHQRHRCQEQSGFVRDLQTVTLEILAGTDLSCAMQIVLTI